MSEFVYDYKWHFCTLFILILFTVRLTAKIADSSKDNRPHPSQASKINVSEWASVPT